jgi:hypothetical protein
MAKTCKYPGCTYPVFGGGYCRAHQWKRTDKKPKPIAKRAVKDNLKALDFGFANQIEMFKHIYFKAKKPIKCMISGRDITDCMNGPINHWIRFYAHILPKGKYTYWKLNPRNIIMLHPEAHHIVDQGTQEDRDGHQDWNWTAWNAEVEFAKEEYQQYVIDNNL